MAEALQVGDLVKLKSGGPTMTYGGEAALFGEALCYWFEGTTRHCERFPYAILHRIGRGRA